MHVSGAQLLVGYAKGWLLNLMDSYNELRVGLDDVTTSLAQCFARGFHHALVVPSRADTSP